MRVATFFLTGLATSYAFQIRNQRSNSLQKAGLLSSGTGPKSLSLKKHVVSSAAPSWIAPISAAIILGSNLVMNPLPANAAVRTSTPASILNHDYADPLHPYCHRKVEVAPVGATFHYSGTSVGLKGDSVLRGCSPDEVKLYKLRKGEFDGQVLVLEDGRFGISAGDGIHEGVWEPKNTDNTNLGYGDVDGIRWNDGNKWIVQSQAAVTKNTKTGTYEVVKKPVFTTVGEGIFYSYIGFSTLAGASGVANAIERRASDGKANRV
eukprot:CAMPEP_0198136522 /NCGR_PEP_ID=MMETSP1443-20131203/168_1 /TAXON_ID=186043 /ORGANISM="Entomoneis sp., Strain CCMP2396" /LENGTH=263 /DNA_ID=CAMNT_0043797757 /DNA_START=82 /DNA_END=873 /DNA_ORIENTATION=-